MLFFRGIGFVPFMFISLAVPVAHAANPMELHRLYDGAARPQSETARLFVPASLEVRSIDGRGVMPALNGVLELLPGTHRLRANPTRPSPEGVRFYKTNEVVFEAAAGGEYRMEGTSDLAWEPTVEPAEQPLGATPEPATPVCWLESIDGVVVSVERKGFKVKRVTLLADGEESPRTWDYVAPALAPPDSYFQGLAARWSLDGSLRGFDVGTRSALKPGRRLRAFYSLCGSPLLVEFQFTKESLKSSP